MSLVADHGVIVRFEDKGSRFVLDTVANHNAALLEGLNDDQHYDKLPSNPLADVVGHVGAFTVKEKDKTSNKDVFISPVNNGLNVKDKDE